MASRMVASQSSTRRRSLAIIAVTTIAIIAIIVSGCSSATDVSAVSAIRIQPSTVALLVDGQRTLHATAVDAAVACKVL